MSCASRSGAAAAASKVLTCMRAGLGEHGVDVLQGRRRAAARRLDELRRHEEAAVGGFDHGADVRVHVDAHSGRDHALALAGGGAERELGNDGSRVLVDDERELLRSRRESGRDADGERDESRVVGAVGRVEGHRLGALHDLPGAEDVLLQGRPEVRFVGGACGGGSRERREQDRRCQREAAGRFRRHNPLLDRLFAVSLLAPSKEAYSHSSSAKAAVTLRA